jgi:hypothetical protein
VGRPYSCCHLQCKSSRITTVDDDRFRSDEEGLHEPRPGRLARVADLPRDDELQSARESPAGAIGRRAEPIVGATIVSHLEDAIAAVKLTVSEEEIRRLQEPYRPHAIAGHQ